MQQEKITLEELLSELEAMINVCFEGETEQIDGHLNLTLPNGQKFVIQCTE